MKVMGIDPGSRNLGLGCVEKQGSKITLVGCGTAKVLDDDWPTRLRKIFEAVQESIDEWQPDCIAIESVFHAKNAQSALKLGQARGAAIAAVVTRGLAVHEYAAREIKQAVTGRGQADKIQIQKMLGIILGAQVKFATHDASDAVAIAICHAQRGGFTRGATPQKGAARIRPQNGQNRVLPRNQ